MRQNRFDSLTTSKLALAALAALAACALAPRRASAAPTKDECIAAHSTGQDEREQGHLTKARKTFMSCAQSSCPSVVQADCARYAEDVGRLLPSVSFAVRDPKRGDLSTADVFVDGVLVANRLDQGKTYELDPGKHVVRVVEGGREVSLPVVVVEGERGRAIVVTFPVEPKDEPAPRELVRSRSSFPLVVAGLGGAVLLSGVVVGVVGLGKVPSSCSYSDRTCSVPPGSPALATAQHGMTLTDAGLGLGIGGAVLAASGLIWYFGSTPRPETRVGVEYVAPWVSRDGGGVGLSGRF